MVDQLEPAPAVQMASQIDQPPVHQDSNQRQMDSLIEDIAAAFGQDGAVQQLASDQQPLDAQPAAGAVGENFAHPAACSAPAQVINEGAGTSGTAHLAQSAQFEDPAHAAGSASAEFVNQDVNASNGYIHVYGPQHHSTTSQQEQEAPDKAKLIMNTRRSLAAATIAFHQTAELIMDQPPPMEELLDISRWHARGLYYSYEQTMMFGAGAAYGARPQEFLAEYAKSKDYGKAAREVLKSLAKERENSLMQGQSSA